MFRKIRNKYLVWRLKHGAGHIVIFDTNKVLRWNNDKVNWSYADDFGTWWIANLAGRGHGAFLYLDVFMLEKHEIRFSHPEDAILFKLIWS